jgi:hypothetical protein
VTRCFVIGPIGNKFADIGTPSRETYEDALQVFEQVILPACRASSLEPVRADQIAVAGEITEQVFRHLYEDEVVIADVSGGNPNVMYELGLRHTRDLLTLQIGEYGQLPFDVSAVRTIQFSRSDRGLIDARKSLQRALAVGLAEGADPVTATRVWAIGAPPDEAVPGTPEADPSASSGERSTSPEEVEVSGLLERLAAIEDGFPRMTETAESIGELLEELGSAAQDVGREIDALNNSGAPARARLTSVTRFAAQLQPLADRLTGRTQDFATEMTGLDEDVRGVLRFLLEAPERARDPEVDGFLTGLVVLARSARESMEGLSQFEGIVRGLGSLSKTLRRPGLQMAQAIRTMAEATALVDEWEAGALRVRLLRDRSGQPQVEGTQDDG